MLFSTSLHRALWLLFASLLSCLLVGPQRRGTSLADLSRVSVLSQPLFSSLFFAVSSSPESVFKNPFGIVSSLPCAGASRINRKNRFPLKVSPNFPFDAAPWRIATGTHPFGDLFKHEKRRKSYDDTNRND
jgi:hypothetical protein